jgi:predicted transglutaminase-like cysteine proteinase
MWLRQGELNMSIRIASVASVLALTAALTATVQKAQAFPLGYSRTLFTAVVEPAKAPKGWLALCKRHPSECNTAPGQATSIELDQDFQDRLTAVNDWVNSRVKPMTDRRHWGVGEKWDYAEDGYGDCEDYVLLKRRMLIGLGYPREALLITVVWASGPRGDEGHSVLTVRTDKGDYVLDNQSKKVLLWNKTRYDFVKRQAQENPNRWVYIDGKPPKPTAVALR